MKTRLKCLTCGAFIDHVTVGRTLNDGNPDGGLYIAVECHGTGETVAASPEFLRERLNVEVVGDEDRVIERGPDNG